jgi:hypothetical protein
MPIEISGRAPTMDERKFVRKFIPKYSTYKNIVQMVLEKKPKTRDSDRALIREVMFYCESNQIPLPSFETISRVRRKFNELGLYKPSARIEKARREKEQMMRHAAKEGLL